MLKTLKPSVDWLLVFVPVAFLLEYVPAWHNPTALFICAGLAIIPLAGIMGRATEHLAEHLGQGIGGLLNATFGNAAELIIALMALHKGLIGVGESLDHRFDYRQCFARPRRRVDRGRFEIFGAAIQSNGDAYLDDGR